MSEINKMDWQERVEVTALDRQKIDSHALFLPLYQRWVQPVYRYALACLRNPADAEDVTSQTFLAVLKEGQPYINSPKFQALLFRIVRNKVIDLTRSQKRRQLVPLEDWLLLETPTPEWTPEELLLLKSSIADLPPGDQELLRLRYVAGLEHAAIAKLLGKTISGVRKALYRLIQRLKMEVGHHDL